MKTEYLHITKNHTGKMSNMWSLSTSAVSNPICVARAKNKSSICSHCYAQRMAKMYKNMNNVLAKNGEKLADIIPTELLPVIPVMYFRFEAFGDLFCVNQVINYFNISKKNPNTKFALWTKNIGYVKQAITEGNEKPKNLSIVYSSPKVNMVTKLRLPFIDHYFTVFDSEEKAQINCGARDCFSCHRCYDSDIVFINEKLK